MSETIGQRLKREREARFITLEKASNETRIREIFLKALESDDYSIMPSAAQGRGFLRNYAEYLDLKIDELIAEIQKNPPVVEEVSGPLPQVNLQETELPPLVEDEKTAPPFWTRWLARKPQPDSMPELSDPEIESLLEDKSEDDGENQIEASDEAKPNLIERIKSVFRFKVKKEEIELVEEIQSTQEVVQEKIPTLPADIIFVEIGQQLRERRELISLTIEEVERHTKLRASFVKALEEGSFDKLPSTVQTKGMLQNYATFLDLDADKVLLRFADALQARRREKYAETPREKIQTQVQASIPLLRTFVAGDLVFGLIMIVVLVTLAIFGVGRVLRIQAEEALEPTVIPFVEVFDEPSATPTIELTIASVNEPLLTTPQIGESSGIDLTASSEINANVVVNLFALERVFVRVSIDGQVVFEGRMSPKESQLFQAENQVVVLTGDGSALRVTYNGADLGLMGGSGEVINRVYLISGVVTPTATVSPTPTNTPLVTVTSTPTRTPIATSTP